MSEELKSCPFCNGAAALISGGAGNYFVQCSGCRASTDDTSRERAIAAWNRRALLSFPRVEDVRREALEEAARVADAMAINRARVSQAAAYACQSVADRIRSLSPPDGDGKQEQATRAEDGPTAPTDR